MERIYHKGLFHVVCLWILAAFSFSWLEAEIFIYLGLILLSSSRLQYFACLSLLFAFQLYQYQWESSKKQMQLYCLQDQQFIPVEMHSKTKGKTDFCGAYILRFFSKDLTLEKKDRFWLSSTAVSDSFFFLNKEDIQGVEKFKYPYQDPLYRAMIKGDSSQLNKQHIEDFRTLGLGHVLALSGMHLTYVLLFIKWILKPIRYSRLEILISCVTLIAYLYYLDFPVSFSRAVSMYVLYSLAKFFRFRISSLSIYLLLLLFSLGLWPNLLLDISFQFSFLAVGGIIYLWPVRERNRMKVKYFGAKIFNGVMDLFFVGFFAQLTLIGLSIYYFQKFAVTSVLFGALVTLPLTILMFVFYLVFIVELIGMELFFDVHIISDLFLKLIRYLRKFGVFWEFQDFDVADLVVLSTICIGIMYLLRNFGFPRLYLQIKIWALLAMGYVLYAFIPRQYPENETLILNQIHQNKDFYYLRIQDDLIPVDDLAENIPLVIHLKGSPKIHLTRFIEKYSPDLILIDAYNAEVLKAKWILDTENNDIPSTVVGGMLSKQDIKKALK